MSENTGERRAAPRGPINGKIGYAIAVVDQLKTVLWMLGGAAVILGFRFSTPAQEMASIKEEIRAIRVTLQQSSSQVNQMSGQVTALVRLSCEARPRDSKIARLNCEAR